MNTPRQSLDYWIKNKTNGTDILRNYLRDCEDYGWPKVYDFIFDKDYEPIAVAIVTDATGLKIIYL